MQTQDLEPLFEGLDPGQRNNVLEAPRQERLGLLADYRKQSEEQILQALARASGLPVVHELNLRGEPTRLIPLRLIHEYQCLPIEPEAIERETIPGEETGATGETSPGDPGLNGKNPANGAASGELPLVTLWPPDSAMDEWVLAACGRQPRWVLGPASRVNETITQVFGVGSGSLEGTDLESLSDGEEAQQEEDEDAAIIRFVNEVIAKAMQDRATDIHFEPQKESLAIRYRIDGQLVPVRVPENLVRFQRAIISRIKIMARMNISERRRPQDGRINFRSGGDELDIRISTLPTMYGESVSLRLLNQRSQPLSIAELGFLPEDEEAIAHPLQRPHGIVLVTGPTGSGKSTSLNAFMRRIRAPERRIITIEDPVEYELEGINQTQVHHEIGLTFAGALRHVLRQDPDVIMVGEIRDRETADIAVRASLTGHLVLSTLHTNDAPGAITRLIDMEIEPFLIASSVEMVIAQRLVRRLCPLCSRPAEIDGDYLASCLYALKIPREEIANAHHLRKAVGCEACRGLGYRGRVGLFEILRVSESIHELIVHRASAREIRKTAVREGMRSLQSCGWAQAKRGMTTLPEIMRYAEGTESEDGT